jgi:hypothetical protein
MGGVLRVPSLARHGCPRRVGKWLCAVGGNCRHCARQYRGHGHALIRCTGQRNRERHGAAGLGNVAWDHGLGRGNRLLLTVFAYATPLVSALILIAFGYAEDSLGLLVGGAS